MKSPSPGMLASSSVFASLLLTVAGSAVPRSSYVSFNGPFSVEANGMHNVEISYAGAPDGELSIHYGSCDMGHHTEANHCLGKTHVGSHPLARRHIGYEDNRPTRFVWLPPSDTPSGGCLHAYMGEELLGKSVPVTVMRRKERRATAFADVADPMGPWFDGVVYLQEKEPDAVLVAQAKNKTVGIIGGGMSGLMTAVSYEPVPRLSE